MIYTLALVEDGNPAKRIVGWPADLHNTDRQIWNLFVKAFPDIGKIPQIGNSNFSQLNVEKIIALPPELVILPIYARTPPNNSQFMQQLQAVNIPVLFLDFRVNPLANTVASLRTLGTALGDEDKSERFIAFYEQHMQRIRDRLESWHGTRPKVMLQLHLCKKAECYTTVSHGNLADLIAFAGGDNIAAGRFPAVFGQLSPEIVIAANPDIYIATGSSGPGESSRLQLGPLVNTDQAKTSFLLALEQDTKASALPAAQRHHAFAFWQNYYMSPWRLLTAEFFAKTFHPQLFHDLSPEETLREMNLQFLPIPETGTYWTHN